MSLIKMLLGLKKPTEVEPVAVQPEPPPPTPRRKDPHPYDVVSVEEQHRGQEYDAAGNPVFRLRDKKNRRSFGGGGGQARHADYNVWDE